MKTTFVKTAFFSVALMSIFMVFTSFRTAEMPGPWEKLGERRVDRRVDHDFIRVTAKEGNFKSIKLLVRHSGINMHRCVVHFANGSKQQMDIRENIPAGGETRVLDLDGHDRFIQRVDFWYDTKGGAFNDKAVIELWAKN